MTDRARPVAGHECEVYYDSADSTSTPTWNRIQQAQDVSEPSSMGEVEASAKASKRKRYIAGLEDAAIEFDYLLVQGGDDEDFNFLYDRYHAKTPVQLAVADGNIATAGTTYLRDWYICTKAETKQELEGARVFSFTFKPTPHYTSGVLDEYSYDTKS